MTATGIRPPRYNAKARQTPHKGKTAAKKKKTKASDSREDAAQKQEPSLATGASTTSVPTKPHASLPFDTTGMSSTKRKRLEKYIEKKLKKEERGTLMEKLAVSSFVSPLMKSSKALGTGKESMRERLRKAFLEERAGLPVSDPTVRLMQEQDVPDLQEFSRVAQQLQLGISTSPAVVGSALKKKKKGVESCSALQEPVVVRSALGKPKDAAKNESLPPAVVGSALKRKDPVPDTLPDTKRSKPSESSDSSDSDSSSDEQEGEDEEGKDEEEVVEESGTVLEPSPPIIKEIPQPSKVEALPQKFFVTVNRLEHIQAARLQLPVVMEEQTVMETIQENAVTILCGETGSGKTTQIPQMLYEAGYGSKLGTNPGKIGVTQPRRVAAVSMAHRVAEEMNTKTEVSYQIRFDGTVTDATVIKFMTDGVLLKEITRDFLLNAYSCLIIDEAHERSLNTDILIGLLSRVVLLREKLSKDKNAVQSHPSLSHLKEVKPLKLIIMSATLRVEDFTENKILFPRSPPLVKISARQYPVSVHFNKRTPDDYITEAFKKVSKIHTRLPSGGILVFVTGQNEIAVLCRKLRQRFPFKHQQKGKCVEWKDNDAKESVVQKSVEDHTVGVDWEEMEVEREEIVDEDCLGGVDESGQLSTDDEDESWKEGIDALNEESMQDAPLHVLPLYALLSTPQQLRIFQDPPPGSRLCVVATNVAETSLTIPNIKYVVDCGKVKERQYDADTAVSSFTVNWTSKASADQRAGRAGRSGPGHCYRLYSSAVFDNYFEQFSRPEIQRMPVEGVFLQMKSMNIDNIVHFPFPTAPDHSQLVGAERLLVQLGALDGKTKRITDLGRTLVAFPVAPRLAKMLMVGAKLNCLRHAIQMVAALTIGDPFIRDVAHEETGMEEAEVTEDSEVSEHRKRDLRSFAYIQKMYSDGTSSDIVKLVQAVGAYENAKDQDEFCRHTFLRPKAMQEITKLCRQLQSMLISLGMADSLELEGRYVPPTTTQMDQLRCVLLAGYVDQVAVRTSTPTKKWVQTTTYQQLVSSVDSKSLMEEIYIHPSSCVFKNPPIIVVYQELVKTSKVYMKGVTEIRDPKVLGEFGRALCTFSKPAENPKPRYVAEEDRLLCHVYPRFGDRSFELPMMEVEFPECMDRYRWMARFLLEGALFPRLTKLVDHLASKPMLVTNAKIPITHSKVMALVQPLADEKIQCRKDLERVWKERPKFLLRGYLTWLPSTLHHDVTQQWPPL